MPVQSQTGRLRPPPLLALPELSSTSRSATFDGIRGFAVLLVFLSHTSARDMGLAPWLNFQGIGHIGVLLFFTLSAWLMCQSYSRDGSVQNFFIRRVFRIVPLYYVVLCMVFLAQSILGAVNTEYLFIQGGISGLLRHLAFAQADGVFWSVGVEFTFYVFFPLLIFFMRARPTFWLGVGLLYGAYHSAVYIAPSLDPSWSMPGLNFGQTKHQSVFLDVFIIPMFLFLVPDKYRTRHTAFLMAAITLATFALVSETFLGLRLKEGYALRWLSWGYAIVFGLMLRDAAAGKAWTQIFDIRVLRFMGIVGYSWYLWHFAIFQIINTFLDVPPSAKFVLAFVLCALVSYLTYILIERPSIYVGRLLVRLVASWRSAHRSDTAT